MQYIFAVNFGTLSTSKYVELDHRFAVLCVGFDELCSVLMNFFMNFVPFISVLLRHLTNFCHVSRSFLVSLVDGQHNH